MTEPFSEQNLIDKGFVKNDKGDWIPSNAYIEGRRSPAKFAPPKPVVGQGKLFNLSDERYRTIEINLFGIPLAKQSVRAANGVFFQPKKYKERIKDYHRQIQKQLPKDFKPFEHRVHVLMMHFVYPPLKRFSRAEMDQIEAGTIIWKNTRGDLSDNLKKLPMDAMSGIIYRDDSIIVSENNVKKYYGTGGIIRLRLKGF